MLIDDVTIQVSSGKGGRGAVSFNKNKMSLGPTGGRGGRGGDVSIEGVADIGALRQFKTKKKLAAGDGGDGKAQFVDGARGQDLILKIPVGTVIHNLTAGHDDEITKTGEQILVARGGFGGKGNFAFRSPIRTTPKISQGGLPGETYNLRLELKLIADVGLIGLPNVGKSSLLNELTRAESRVANYEFTTLEPHLGVYQNLVLADIPGLIEGAASGKGLGVKFLRHIERTRILFHIIAADSKDPTRDYRTIRRELGLYSKKLLQKNEYIILSKTDTLDMHEKEVVMRILKKLSPIILPISIYDKKGMDDVRALLNTFAKEK